MPKAIPPAVVLMEKGSSEKHDKPERPGIY
jgi:hypothetical protein